MLTPDMDGVGAGVLPVDGVELSLVDESETMRLPDVVVETKMLAGPKESNNNETYFSIAIQVFIPFLIAGFGMVGAGLVLDIVQHWVVFEDITEILILVLALLGLKGNLEMTLASRLSTQANLGHMDTPRQQWSMIAGNITLIQGGHEPAARMELCCWKYQEGETPMCRSAPDFTGDTASFRNVTLTTFVGRMPIVVDMPLDKIINGCMLDIVEKCGKNS